MTCPKCLRWYDAGEEPDPCLGELPGVVGACCGHGDSKKAYMSFANGVVLRPLFVEKDNGIYRPQKKP